jgi:hypothetical protein
MALSWSIITRPNSGEFLFILLIRRGIKCEIVVNKNEIQMLTFSSE